MCHQTKPPWLSWNLVCRPGWPWAYGDPPTSACRVLRLKACAVILGFVLFCFVCLFFFSRVWQAVHSEPACYHRAIETPSFPGINAYTVQDFPPVTWSCFFLMPYHVGLAFVINSLRPEAHTVLAHPSVWSLRGSILPFTHVGLSVRVFFQASRQWWASEHKDRNKGSAS